MESPGLGHSKIWKLPKWHKFHLAGVWHDLCYDIRRNNSTEHPEYFRLDGLDWAAAESASEQKTSHDADFGFYHRCRKIVGGRTLEAWIYYQIVKVWGRLFW